MLMKPLTVCVFVCVCFRCEDMVDVRRLKMLQMVQLFKCEEDALQVGHTTTTHTQTHKNTACVDDMVIYVWVCVYVCACVFRQWSGLASCWTPC